MSKVGFVDWWCKKKHIRLKPEIVEKKCSRQNSKKGCKNLIRKE